MTAAWMLSSTIVAILLALAALALARVAALYRSFSLRWAWALATIASLAFAFLWLRPSPVMPSVPVTSASTNTNGPSRPLSERLAASVSSTPRAPTLIERVSRIELPRIPLGIERTMVAAWMVASSVLLILIAVATTRLYVERRQWEWQEVANTPVLVSAEFGPAIVGVVHPAIVLPEWVLTLDDAAQRAIVAHEEEHRSANDPALVLAGLVALVLMPWNLGLWMSWRGLRRAIELDCDARVLARGIDGGEYARVLLGAWNSARGSWLPSTAFAERASGLGARVEHLMRPAPRRRVMRTILGTTVAAGLVLIACATPSPQRATPDVSGPYPLIVIDGVKRPDLPPQYRFTGAVVVETTTTPTYRITYRGPRVADTVAQKQYPSMDDGTLMQTIDAPASITHFGEAAKYGVVLYYTKKYRDGGGAIIAPTEGNQAVRAADPATPAADMAGGIYASMFNGITLSPERAVQARAIIETEFAQMRDLHGPALAVWPRRIASNAARDAELRTLLTTDADRATFDRHSLEGRPRGELTMEVIVDADYRNLFVFPNENRPEPIGPVLPADKKSAATGIIQKTINDEMVIYARAPNAWDDTYADRLALRMRRDADLRALLPTEAEKLRFDRFANRLRANAFPRP